MCKVKCIYDNPKTRRREYWVNGRLVGWYTEEFLAQAGAILNVMPKMEKHVSRFTAGMLEGDSNAMGGEKNSD